MSHDKIDPGAPSTFEFRSTTCKLQTNFLQDIWTKQRMFFPLPSIFGKHIPAPGLIG